MLLLLESEAQRGQGIQVTQAEEMPLVFVDLVRGPGSYFYFYFFFTPYQLLFGELIPELIGQVSLRYKELPLMCCVWGSWIWKALSVYKPGVLHFNRPDPQFTFTNSSLDQGQR